jgi:hypothetical protein
MQPHDGARAIDAPRLGGATGGTSRAGATSMTFRPVLEAFSRKEVDAHAVMRALVAHDDWLVPSVYAGQVLGHTTQQVVMLGDRIRHPAGSLLLYSDLETAVAVCDQGALLGPYASGMRGAEIFKAIAPDIATIVVNEGAPQAQKLYLGAPSFGNAGVWVDTVAFEDALTGRDATLAAKSYDAYFVLFNPDGALSTVANVEGMAEAVVLCTAPDCRDAFASLLERHFGRRPEVGQTTGERVAHALPQLGVDGVVINPVGPGVTRALTLQELTR